MQASEKSNTVKSAGQVAFHVSFDGEAGGTPRIMIIGNSITRHAPSPSIGWYHDHGMAASAKERDYVHVFMREVRKRQPNAVFCIVQAAVWESSYTSCNYDEYFAAAKGFHPDTVITALSGNIRAELFEHDAFIREMGAFHAYLTDGGSPRFIQASTFFGNEEKCRAIRDYMSAVGGTYVDIGEIAKDEANLAIGQYEHKGIQVHPGDRGMALIAERLLEAYFGRKIYNG